MLNEENEKAVLCGLLKPSLLSVTLINQHRKLLAWLHMGVQQMDIDVCFLIC